MTNIGLSRKIFFYLSNMLPTFIASLIIYGIPYGSNTLLNKAFSSFLIAMTAISVCGFILWLTYLKHLDTDRTTDEKSVKETREISSVISSYILAYAVSVISVAVVGGLKGMLLLLVLVTIFGLYAFSWNVMLFNPFLMLFGYRVYSMELEDESTGYFIRKITGGPVKNPRSNKYSMLQIDSYFYYLKE
jgi:uncharacterized membrane protein YidH (DUF202 family)